MGVLENHACNTCMQGHMQKKLDFHDNYQFLIRHIDHLEKSGWSVKWESAFKSILQINHALVSSCNGKGVLDVFVTYFVTHMSHILWSIMTWAGLFTDLISDWTEICGCGARVWYWWWIESLDGAIIFPQLRNFVVEDRCPGSALHALLTFESCILICYQILKF